MSTETPQQVAWRHEFESMSESTVRLIAEPLPGAMVQADKCLFAKVWLEEELSHKRDNREIKTLDIAKAALAASEEANRIALVASASRKIDHQIAGIAIIISLVAAYDKIRSLIETIFAALRD